MNIDEAARATRKYKMSFIYGCGKGPSGIAVCMEGEDDDYIKMFSGTAEAQTACDYLNLLAVLEAIREPSAEMNRAGYDAFEDGYVAAAPRYTAMIDALIAEVNAQK